MRAHNEPRTIHSAIALFEGLYPMISDNPNFDRINVKIETPDIKRDIMRPNGRVCPLYKTNFINALKSHRMIKVKFVLHNALCKYTHVESQVFLIATISTYKKNLKASFLFTNNQFFFLGCVCVCVCVCVCMCDVCNVVFLFFNV